MKKKLFAGVIGLVLVLIQWVGSGTVMAASSDSPSPLPHLICSSSSLPRGWVIIQRETDWSSCSGGILTIDNVEAIAPPPTQSTSVCYPSAIPSGFVVTKEVMSSDCSKNINPVNEYSATNNKQESIQPVDGASQLEVCGSSPIPDGFVVTAEGPMLQELVSPTVLLCNSDTFTKKYDQQITLVTGTAMQVCADSPLPEGYKTIASNVFVNECFNDNGTSHLIALSN